MYKQIDMSKIRTRSVNERTSKVSVDDYARVFDPESEDFGSFADSLPKILKAADLRALARTVAEDRRRGMPVLFMMGAHVIKTGLAPIVIDLMRRGVVTCVAMNSAAAIHDVEAALFGATSEDVSENLADGAFGMWRETGDFINGALSAAYAEADCGYAEALGRALLASARDRCGDSVLGAAVEADIPVTVHAAIGTDITHQQPGMSGAATGELSFRDFKVLCNNVKDLKGGGVVMNVGSAVLLPEVFLKALTVARNLGHAARGFTAVNFDMIQHYRPNTNVVLRPTRDGGTGYSFTGHHEIMIPLLAAMVKLEIGKGGAGV